MRTILLLLFVCGVTWAQAQEVVPATPLAPNCLMATTVEEWSRTGANSDQVEQLRALQSRCHTDCTSEDGTRKEDEAMIAVLRKYEEEVARILSSEQFARWKTWCAERPVGM